MQDDEARSILAVADALDAGEAKGQATAAAAGETPPAEPTGDRDRPGEDRHAEYVPTKEAIQKWDVSRATLLRYREEGKLTSHRPPNAPPNAPYRYDPADLDSHFEPRNRPREGPRA